MTAGRMTLVTHSSVFSETSLQAKFTIQQEATTYFGEQPKTGDKIFDDEQSPFIGGLPSVHSFKGCTSTLCVHLPPAIVKPPGQVDFAVAKFRRAHISPVGSNPLSHCSVGVNSFRSTQTPCTKSHPNVEVESFQQTNVTFVAYKT